MALSSYQVLSLMSGTSLDGLDMAYCEFTFDNSWSFELLKHKSVTYPEDFKKVLQNAIHLPSADLLHLNNTYGTWLGEHCKNFTQEVFLQPDIIASHGHTIHHQPQKGLTYQIGSGQHLANASGIRTVCDFRTGDMALGGQGAPLVPMGDALLFNHYDFCINIGGICNVSFEENGKRIAFDIGLGNMPLNYLMQQIGKDHDHNGALASTGQQLPLLFDLLNALDYYQQTPPKSTGYEWFSEKVVPLLDTTQAELADKLHTVIHHNCFQIANTLKEAQNEGASVLITGGGAKNHFFMEVLKEYLGSDFKITIPDKALIDFKEAIIFGLLGVLRNEGMSNCLASVTGAAKDSCTGVIYLPQ